MNSEFILLTLAIGIAFSFLLSDPPNRFHPVSWLGKLVSSFIPKLKHANAKREKLNGFVLTMLLVIGSALAIHYFSTIIYKIYGIFALCLFSVLVIKFTAPILTLERHVQAIIHELEMNNLDKARKNLSFIVGRNTGSLDREHIISATIESIGESTVDGIVSVLFYYSILGPIGAIGYRIINTLDSMIGYADAYHQSIGWTAAKLDTISNYIPARICALLIVISSNVVGADWKNSIFIMRKYHKNTPSVNGGYPMSALAGALRVRLEKIGFYELGINIEPLSIKKCKDALRMVKITVILFFLIVSSPIIILLSYADWWEYIYVF